jgi:hypothetical protein
LVISKSSFYTILILCLIDLYIILDRKIISYNTMKDYHELIYYLNEYYHKISIRFTNNMTLPFQYYHILKAVTTHNLDYSQ